MVKNEDKQKREELRFFYDKAIEGRNFHYKSYMTYMNLYAIFTGAFFVALYSIKKTENCTDCTVLLLIVMFLGLLSSICWSCSVIGYYHWLSNWINVVQYYEKCLNAGKESDEAHLVYTLHSEKSEYWPFSTQKLTIFFVTMVALGWLLMIVYEILRKIGIECLTLVFGCCALPLLFFVLWLVKKLKYFKSDVSGHFVLKKKYEPKTFQIVNDYVIDRPQTPKKPPED